MRSRTALAIFRTLLGSRLPTTEGVLEVPGSAAPIRIDRDRYGIPHVTATNDADAWYGLGFCQGQDRAFQVESMVRVVRGTVSALVGEETLQLDRLSRRIGFLRSATSTWDLFDERDQTNLEAFTRGINNGREFGLDRLSHEFALLRGKPSQVTAIDIIGILALESFALASNWDSELARLEILEKDGERALEAVDPVYPEWHPVTDTLKVPTSAPIESLRADLELLRDVIGISGASNNWALQGSLTSTGQPLVANDPHLSPTLPPHWYLSHLKTPQWGLAGASFAATPFFASAHNGHVAWGVTAGLVDNTDLFIEKIGDDGASTQRGDLLVPCEVVDEIIEIRNSDTVTERVLITPLGPIVGPAFSDQQAAISIAATWLKPQRASLLSGLGRAQTVDDLRSELSEFSGPSLNWIAADDSGSILWQLAGESPVRKTGRGALPLPAWRDDVGWEDEYVPFSEMPWSINPDSGFVASANSRPSSSEKPFLGVDWIEGYRLARIIEMIRTRNNWSVSSTLQAQLDTVTHAWNDLKRSLLAAPHTADSTTARALLGKWDGNLSTDSAAGSVFVLWATAMQRRVAEVAAPQSHEAALGKSSVPEALMAHSMFAFKRTSHLAKLLRHRPEGWFDNWDHVIISALEEAEGLLRSRLGSDSNLWNWGKARPLVLKHAVSSRKPMDKVFDLGPIPWSGDFTTVSQSGAPPLNPLGNPSAIASLRMAVDIGSWDDARFSLPGGQSGNPLSPHYDDQIEKWRNGVGVPMAWTDEAVKASTKKTLHLIPRNHG